MTKRKLKGVQLLLCAYVVQVWIHLIKSTEVNLLIPFVNIYVLVIGRLKTAMLVI